MIELLYFASQIQCSAGSDLLNIKVDVYHNQEIIETMMVNEKVLVPVDSIEDLTFKYSVTNSSTSCGLAAPSELVLSPEDQVPNLAGVYEQDSIKDLLNGLNEYEELFLVELGTTDESSSAFDLQDVVYIVDNNPTIPDEFLAQLFPD